MGVCMCGRVSAELTGCSGPFWIHQIHQSVSGFGSRKMSSNTAIMGNLPSGIGICTTIPDILYLPELVRCTTVQMLVSLFE